MVTNKFAELHPNYVKLVTRLEQKEEHEIKFCVPAGWAEDWLFKTNNSVKSLTNWVKDYDYKESEQMYWEARETGMLLPVNHDCEENPSCMYHIKSENEELAGKLAELNDDDFYDVMMCLAQKMGIAWLNPRRFTEHLRLCLEECLDNLLNAWYDADKMTYEEKIKNFANNTVMLFEY